jgi:hypothetical protein
LFNTVRCPEHTKHGLTARDATELRRTAHYSAVHGQKIEDAADEEARDYLSFMASPGICAELLSVPVVTTLATR